MVSTMIEDSESTASVDLLTVDTVPTARVLGTQPASPLTFWASLTPGNWLQLDDVVITERDLPGQGSIVTSGVVTQVQARHEGASYDSDVHLIVDGSLPAEVTECAEITVTRVEPEVYVPPTPGSAVRRARGAQRESALYFDSMDAKLPIGLARDGEPVYANFEFLDGTKGAHGRSPAFPVSPRRRVMRFFSCIRYLRRRCCAQKQ
jgi:hypothetical protein